MRKRELPSSNATHMTTEIVVVVCALVSLYPGIGRTQRLDTGHQRQGMHSCCREGESLPNCGVCKDNEVIVGVHVGENLLLCQAVNGPDFQTEKKDPAPGQASPGTQYCDPPNKNCMHSCPDGWVMTGFRHDQNVLLCVQWGQQPNVYTGEGQFKLSVDPEQNPFNPKSISLSNPMREVRTCLHRSQYLPV